MTDPPRLFELLLRWEEQGRKESADTLCRDCLHLKDDLVAAMDELKKLDWLKDPSGGSGPASRRAPDPPGTHPLPFQRGAEPIPGYRLLRRLGVGAFGQVWAVESPEGEMQALKIMHGLASVRPESEALERLRGVYHPMILSIHRVEMIGETLMIVSELADGPLGPLFDLLRRIDPPFQVTKKCLSLLRCAAEGLDYLHSLGLLHLDVKPANLLVVGQHWCKVGDFGTLTAIRTAGPAEEDVVLGLPSEAAEPDPGRLRGGATVRYGSVREVPWGQALHRHATLYTRLGAFTPYYAPPEAFTGMVSRSFDQYSLALTFCELVSGMIPFYGDGERQVEQRKNGDIDVSFLPPELRPLVVRSLSPVPAERFPSCRALVNELDHALEPPRP